MIPVLRVLEAANPDGVKATVEAIYHVVRSPAEVEAKTPQHFLAFFTVDGAVYVDVVDADREDHQKGDAVAVTWTKTSEGDGMPFLTSDAV